MEALCQQQDVPYLYKDVMVQERNDVARARGEAAVSLGSTELGRIIQASGGAVQGTTLQVPTTGYHTMEESAAIAGCEAFIELLAAWGI